MEKPNNCWDLANTFGLEREQPRALVDLLSEALQETSDPVQMCSKTAVLNKLPSTVRKICPDGVVYEISGDPESDTYSGIAWFRYYPVVGMEVFLEIMRVKMRQFGEGFGQQVVAFHCRYIGRDQLEQEVANAQLLIHGKFNKVK